MRGLKDYIKKHGNHFTEELALSLPNRKWDEVEISRMAQRRVYYNVTSATLGDMVFLTNFAHQKEGWPRSKCISFCLKVIGDYGVGEGIALSIFKEVFADEDFDLTPYI